jgi:hypothetical protein
MLDRITMQRSMRVMGVRGDGRREVLGPRGSPGHATRSARLRLEPSPSHAFIAAAATLDTYYALVGLRSNLFDTALDLGARDAAPHRAGVFGSRQLADRVVTRREQASGRAWWTRPSATPWMAPR